MSIIASRMARPLRSFCTRRLSGMNIPYIEVSDGPKRLIDAHKREITRLQSIYEKQLSELRQELESLKDAQSKWERRDMLKRRVKQKQWIKQEQQEPKRESERSSRSSIEAQLMRDKIQLLHEVVRLRKRVSAASSLGIIDSVYRRRHEDILGPLPPDSQSVLSAIIDGALDEPSHSYAHSRQKAISLLDPTLQKDEVDEAGHHLYRTCFDQVPIQPYGQSVILREGQLSLPSVAAFFALAHWSEMCIPVEYQLKSGSVAGCMP
ncbi:hypothetical protein EDD85DRAFT_183707 [Armillaria nabsnona]|nr:hypothetical protein EDD85DRAFT_183707 [Armillaria nabsnona]